MPLNVLVVESDRRAADDAVGLLTGAGHVVLRCHEPDSPSFPCVGMRDQAACPLRSHDVDVALAVRAHARSEPAREEHGARCAIMHRVPLVVAGPAVLDPYADFESRVVDDIDDIVATCEDVATGRLERHSTVAKDALAASREPDPYLAGARAVVTRRRGRLLVTLGGLDALERRQRDAAVVRVMAKLREYDPSVAGIDIVVDEGA